MRRITICLLLLIIVGVFISGCMSNKYAAGDIAGVGGGSSGSKFYGQIVLDYDSEKDMYQYTTIERGEYGKWPSKSEFIKSLKDRKIQYQDRMVFEDWHNDVIGHIDL